MNTTSESTTETSTAQTAGISQVLITTPQTSALTTGPTEAHNISSRSSVFSTASPGMSTTSLLGTGQTSHWPSNNVTSSMSVYISSSLTPDISPTATISQHFTNTTKGIIPDITTISSLLDTTLNGTQTYFKANFSILKNQTNHQYYYHDLCTTLECIYVKPYRLKFHDDLVNLSILLAIIGIIGAVGNTLVIMVFARNKVKKTSTYFMLTLSIIDLMVCTIVIPGVIARQWRMKLYSDVLCRGLEFMRSLMIPSSAMVLVAITFDRFFLICMSTKEIMTSFVIKIIIVMIMLLGMSLGIPALLSHSVYVSYDDGTLYNSQFCFKNDRYISDIGRYQYWYFVTALFGAMIVVIFTLYLLIFKKVIQQSNTWKNHRKIFPERRNTAGALQSKMMVDGISNISKKESANNTIIIDVEGFTDQQSTMPQPSTSGVNSRELKTRNSKQAMSINSNTNIKTMSDMRRRSTHIKTTQVLFIVTLVYIFSFLPTFLETNEVLSSNMYLTYVYFINNAANPIIYSFMNAKFREEARRLYCKCIKA